MPDSLEQIHLDFLHGLEQMAAGISQVAQAYNRLVTWREVVSQGPIQDQAEVVREE